MTLQATMGNTTSLRITMGPIVDPSAIWPEPGNASLGDFLYNTHSEDMRNQLVISATPRRIELRATTGIPAFVSVAGRWAAVFGTIFVDSTTPGDRYLFADLSANNGAFVLTTALSPVPGAWQKLLGSYHDTGAVISSLSVGILGVATDSLGGLTIQGANGAVIFVDADFAGNSVYVSSISGALRFTPIGYTGLFTYDKDGLIGTTGTTSGIRLTDRANVRTATLYRTGDLVRLDDSVNSNILSLLNTGLLTSTGTTSGHAFTDRANARLVTLYRTGDVVKLDDSVNGTLLTMANTGLLTSTGTTSGHVFTDRANARTVLLYRTGDVTKLDDSVNGTIWSLGNSGLNTLAGTTSGTVYTDRANARTTTIYRTGDVTKIDDSVNGTILTLDNAGAVTVAPTATGTTGLTVNGKASGTVNVARFSAAATTNGQVVDVDKNGHIALSQAAVPTGILGIGAGTGGGTAPVLTITGTDQAGIIQVVTGTQVPSAGNAIVAFSFKTAMATAPWAVQVQFANGTAQALARNQDPVAVSLSTTGFVLFAGAAAIAASSTYQWSYQVK